MNACLDSGIGIGLPGMIGTGSGEQLRAVYADLAVVRNGLTADKVIKAQRIAFVHDNDKDEPGFAVYLVVVSGTHAGDAVLLGCFEQEIAVSTEVQISALCVCTREVNGSCYGDMHGVGVNDAAVNIDVAGDVCFACA